MFAVERSSIVSGHARSIALTGLSTELVEIDVQLAQGLPSFSIVGLPDKAVNESRERVRGALAAIGISIPPKRIVVNLAPASLVKEGSHLDLPITLALLVVIGVLKQPDIDDILSMGELSLDGSIRGIPGVIPGALAAVEHYCRFICPAEQGGEAACVGDQIQIAAPASLLALIQHVRGETRLPQPEPMMLDDEQPLPDLIDVKGQETAKRALEVAAAGGHNMLIVGPPGSGKSMLAARLPGILPPLQAQELLEVSMIKSVAGDQKSSAMSRNRPFRAPHHAASMAAMVGGGIRARPGEVSLAHHGVLFLDELPEFGRQVLESLRQPIEAGTVSVARANVHATYPARFQLIAAMNPCRCGHLGDPAMACSRAPKCGADYQRKISGPLLDRIDIRIEVPAVAVSDLALPTPSEDSEEIKLRVENARYVQRQRFAALGRTDLSTNCQAEGLVLDQITDLTDRARKLIETASQRLRLSARGYYRVLRVARTVADLAGSDMIDRPHLAEAISYRGGFGLANQ